MAIYLYKKWRTPIAGGNNAAPAPINTPPVITSGLPVQTAVVGSAVNLQLSASDDGTVVGWNISGVAGLDISSTGLITGFLPAIPGSYTASVTCMDDGGLSSVARDVSWNATSPAASEPVVTAIADVSTRACQDISIQVAATEQNNLPMSYAMTGHPSGLTINTSTGLISGELSAATGTFLITVTVSSTGGATSTSFTMTVIRLFAPSITPVPTNFTVEPNVAMTPIVHTWTDPNGCGVDVTVTNLPVGVTAAIDETARTITISGTPTVAGMVQPTIGLCAKKPCP